MGEATEAMLNGDVCQQCGTWLDGGAAGYPVSCGDCGEPDWDAQKRLRQQRGSLQRAAAEKHFAEARDLAACCGMQLQQCSDTHYQLFVAKSIYNLYPGNGRIYADTNRPRLGYLNLAGKRWTLKDVVEAAHAKVIEKGAEAE